MYIRNAMCAVGFPVHGSIMTIAVTSAPSQRLDSRSGEAMICILIQDNLFMAYI